MDVCHSDVSRFGEALQSVSRVSLAHCEYTLQRLDATGAGNGPVAAFVAAINSIVGPERRIEVETSPVLPFRLLSWMFWLCYGNSGGSGSGHGSGTSGGTSVGCQMAADPCVPK